jgi:hypothetical protein
MDELNSIELNNIIADKKPTTQQAYKRDYKRLRLLLDVDTIINNNKLTKPITAIIKAIKNSEFSKNTQKGLFNMLVMIFQKNPNFKSQQVKVESEREKMNNKIEIERKDKNKELLEILPAQKTIDKDLNDLYNQKEYLKYIINYLVITYNLRNKDLCLKIVSSMKQTKDTEFNYLVITEKYVSFIRNVYKTASTYGKKDNRVQSKKFRDALLKFLDLKEVDYKNEEYVIFNDRSGEPLNCNKIGDRLKYLLIENETKLNKIKVKEINNKPNTIKGLKKMEKNRGTDIKTIATYYSIEN